MPSTIKTLKYSQTILLSKLLKIYTYHESLLRCILILKGDGPEIEFIQNKKNKVTDTLSRFTNNGNQETMQEFNYTR